MEITLNYSDYILLEREAKFQKERVQDILKDKTVELNMIEQYGTQVTNISKFYSKSDANMELLDKVNSLLEERRANRREISNLKFKIEELTPWGYLKMFLNK